MNSLKAVIEMTNELKPCPFCGVPESEDTVNFDHHADGCYLKLIELNIRIAYKNSIYGTNFNRIPEACVLEAWNTRAERTCTVDYPNDARMCSECAHYVAPNSRYCSHCGAKVVE